MLTCNRNFNEKSRIGGGFPLSKMPQFPLLSFMSHPTPLCLYVTSLAPWSTWAESLGKILTWEVSLHGKWFLAVGSAFCNLEQCMGNFSRKKTVSWMSEMHQKPLRFFQKSLECNCCDLWKYFQVKNYYCIHKKMRLQLIIFMNIKIKTILKTYIYHNAFKVHLIVVVLVFHFFLWLSHTHCMAESHFIDSFIFLCFQGLGQRGMRKDSIIVTGSFEGWWKKNWN